MNMFRQLRNLWIPCATTLVLGCCGNAFAQKSYKVVDLGTEPNHTFSMVMAINDRGWTYIMDGSFAPGQSDFLPAYPLIGRDVVDFNGFKVDVGTLGGQNSWMNWGQINDLGQVVGYSETAVPDPNGEDVCRFGTHRTCRPFLWEFSHMIALPTLGGNNGQASGINNHGQIVGMAENGEVDSSCAPGTTNNRIELPVLWEHGKPEALPTVDRDPDGLAFWINDHGQAVGFSGNCGGALHAISWEDDTASQLPDQGHGGTAWGINNLGQIVGQVGSDDGSTQLGAVWQNDTLIEVFKDLLPGDIGNIAFGNNNRGQVVGGSWDSTFHWAHAFIWQDGVMTNLNTLFPDSSNICATFAAKINDRGEIGGMGFVRSGPDKGQVHAFVATPVNETVGRSVADVEPTCSESNSPANSAKRLLQRFGPGRFER
jgi:probable HAF family extracellular repeat protein